MGDRNRICKEHLDPEVVKVFSGIDSGKIKHNLSSFFVRPLYQYTKAEVGRVPNV